MQPATGSLQGSYTRVSCASEAEEAEDNALAAEKKLTRKAKFSVQEATKGVVGGNLLASCIGVLQHPERLSAETERTTACAVGFLSLALIFQLVSLVFTANQGAQEDAEKLSRGNAGLTAPNKPRNWRFWRVVCVCFASLFLIVGTALTSAVLQSVEDGYNAPESV